MVRTEWFPGMNELALDDKTIRFIESKMAQMKALESELNGALSLLIEQNGLTGRWQLDLPNRRLIPAEPQQIREAA